MSDIFWLVAVFLVLIIPASLGFYSDSKAKAQLKRSRIRLDSWNRLDAS